MSSVNAKYVIVTPGLDEEGHFDVSPEKDYRSKLEYTVGFGSRSRKERVHEAVEILGGAGRVRLAPREGLAHRQGVQRVFIRPGKPVENTFSEPFSGLLRDEYLNCASHRRSLAGGL